MGLRCLLFGHSADTAFDDLISMSFRYDGSVLLRTGPSNLDDDGTYVSAEALPGPAQTWYLHRCRRCGTLYTGAGVLHPTGR